MHGEVLSADCAAKYHVGEGCGTDTFSLSSGFIPSDCKLNYVIILAMLVLKALVSSCPPETLRIGWACPSLIVQQMLFFQG